MRAYLRLLAYMRPYARVLFAALALMALYAAMNFASLGMISPLMSVLFERTERESAASAVVAAPPPPADAAAVRPGTERLPGWPEPFRAWGQRVLVRARPLVALERICLIFLPVFFLKNLADYLQSFLMASIEQATIRDLRRDLYAHLHRLSLSFYHGRRTGTLISRITNDVEYLRASLASGISNLVKDGLTLIGCLVWVFRLSWGLALLSFVVLPPVAFTLVSMGR